MNVDDPARFDLVQPAMRKELLRSERSRVLVLLGVLAFLLLLLLLLRAVPTLLPDSLRAPLQSAFVAHVSVLSCYMVYEGSVLIWLTRLLRQRVAMPSGFPFVNTLMEVSLPSVAILASALAMGGLPTLVGAAPFLYFPFLCLVALNLDFRLCVFGGAIACVEFIGISLLLVHFDASPATGEIPVMLMLKSPHHWVIKGAIILTTGFVVGFVARQIRRQLSSALQTLEERDRAVSIFGQHVSPQVADMLLKQPMDYSGQERTVCIMFFDIRDFSRIAGAHSPTEVMDYLNTLFGLMIPAVNGRNGIINKFLGDGFMAVFGAMADDGQQCRQAVDASRAILAAVEQLNREGRIPPTRVGIGLHLGVALTGNVGSGDRKEYTIIGDAVNLASRIEQATKQFHAQLLISEAVAQALDEPSGTDLGLVELKGQAAPVRLYQLA